MRYKLFLLLCFSFQLAWCQQKVGYVLNAEVVRIPFQMVNQSMMVKVNLNEHKNLSFIVDTGSSFSVVFTDSVFTLPTQYKLSSIRGFGKLDSIPAQVSAYNTLSLGALTSYGHQMLVVEKADIGFQQFFDKPLHGIIGFDVLRNFDMEINFVRKKLILRKHMQGKKSGKRWTTIPFDITTNALLVPATIKANQQTDSIQLILDTGSELPLLLSERYCPPISLRTIIGLGFLGYTSGRIGQIDELKIGKVSLKRLTTSFPDSASVKWNPKLPPRGNLGIQFLKQFRVIINFHEKYLQLKQIHPLSGDALEYNRSGMAIVSKSKSNSNCAYYVDEIVAGSAAEKAGLLEGDRILSIKNIRCPDITLDEIHNYLFSKTSNLKMEVFRKGKVEKIVLDLSEQPVN
ncbi:MAG TPA: aspartyl protease family protein [Cyclobacteriaceae bacterium]